MPPQAEPDDKDWTWVLERPCPDCGADVGQLSIEQVAELNRTCAADWAEVLRMHADVRDRPEPDVWSPGIGNITPYAEQRLDALR